MAQSNGQSSLSETLMREGFSDQEIIRALPKCLALIAEISSVDAALNIAEHHGGAVVYIPGKATPGHRLEKRFGKSAFIALCQHFGGETLEIPNASKVKKLIRNKRIHQAHSKGASMNDLARRYGMSSRHMRRLLSNPL